MTRDLGPDPQQFLDQAKALLNLGILQESLAAFKELINPGMQADLYFLGVTMRGN